MKQHCFISKGAKPANNYYLYKYLPQSVPVFTSFRLINSKTHSTNKEICRIQTIVVLHLGSQAFSWILLLSEGSQSLAQPRWLVLVGSLLTLVIQLIFIFYFLSLLSVSTFVSVILLYHHLPWEILSLSSRNVSDFSSRYLLVVAPAGDMIYDVPPRIVKILQYHNLINKPRKKLEFY